MAEIDVAAYLERLCLDEVGPPSLAGLFALHRAHVAHVPYENLEIQLGRPTTVDPYESASRILRGRGGYCYHLNGALSVLLRALGYDVRWHVGGVQGRAEAHPVGANASHLALTVHGLPAPEAPHGVWLVDAGLGDGPHEPLPLRPGRHCQGPFTYGVAPSAVVNGGWRFVHDPEGSFAGMDFAWPEAAPADFGARHEYLSTSPQSGFVRTLVVKRRDAAGVDMLRGCVLTRLDASGRREARLDTRAEWFDALADRFGLTLDDVDRRERAALWRRVCTAHTAWLAEQAAS